MIDEKLWKHQCELIHAMDIIVRGFNDEEWIESWLAYGVQDVMDTYPNDEGFEQEFKDLQWQFVNLIAWQCRGKGGAIAPRLTENLLY